MQEIVFFSKIDVLQCKIIVHSKPTPDYVLQNQMGLINQQIRKVQKIKLDFATKHLKNFFRRPNKRLRLSS